MKAIALRFSEKFSPDCGTIAAHQRIIDDKGFVWYGKMGPPVSDKNIQLVLNEKIPRVLLIHSGGSERYWAEVKDIKKVRPSFDEFPDYYHNISDDFKTWFKIVGFSKAPKGVMGNCTVLSSGQPLSLVSKYSMSPYYVVEYNEG